MARDLKAKIRLEADVKNAAANLKKAEKALDAVETSSDELSSSLKGLTGEFVKTDAQVDALSSDLSSLDDRLDETGTAADDLTRSTDALSTNLDELRGSLSNVDGTTGTLVDGMTGLSNRMGDTGGTSGNLSGQMDTLSGEMTNAGNSAETFGERLSALKVKITIFIAAVTAAVLSVKKFITVANEHEDAVQSLDAALGNLNGEYQQLSNRLQQQALDLSRVTKFSDEEILAVQQRIALFIKEEAALKGLTIASLDLAAAKSRNATEIADALVRSIVTENNALLEQGIIITGTANSAERLATAFKSLSEFEGQAASQAETSSGKFNQLADSFINIVAGFGSAITSSERFNSILDQGITILRGFEKGIDDIVFSLTTLSVRIQALVESVMPAWISSLIGAKGAQFAASKADLDRANTLRGLQEEQEKANKLETERIKILTESRAETDATSKAEVSLTAVFTELGIVTEEQVNVQLEEQQAILRVLRERFDDGKVSVEAFGRAEENVLEKIRQLQAGVTEQAAVIVIARDGQEVYNSTLERTAAILDVVTAAETRNADVTEAAVERRLTFREREARATGTQIIFGQRTTQGGTFTSPDEIAVGVNGRVEIVRNVGAF